MRLLIGVRLALAFYLAAVCAFGSEIRCRCNLPSCNKANSMCKSVLGCFQELPSSINRRELRHGCLELWPSKKSYQCAADIIGGNDEIVVQKLYSTKEDESSLTNNDPQTLSHHSSHNQRRHNTIALRCCLQDMCNFVDIDRFGENHLQTLELNVLSLNNNSGDRNDGVLVSKTPNSTSFNVGNAWFTAALIIVPVFGAFVLVLLIMFACYLLKYDVKQQNIRRANYYDAVGNEFDADDDELDDSLFVCVNKFNGIDFHSTPLSNPVMEKTCQSLPFFNNSRLIDKSADLSSAQSLRTTKSDSALV